MTESISMSLVTMLLLAAAASTLAWLLRLPSILLLLAFGFLAGPVAGVLDPDELFGPLLLPFVSLFVALILFEGGLGLTLREIRGVSSVVRNLVTVGAAITWAVGGLGAHYILGLDWKLACLLGSILCVTGPTVVLPLLEHVKPRGTVGPILKWEGIVIDPIGAILAVIAFEIALLGDHDSLAALVGVALARSLVVGVSVGIAGAGLVVLLIRYHVLPLRLHATVALVLVLGGFVISNQLQAESGLLAVTVMGVALANQRIADIRSIVAFKENLREVLLSSLFIVLSARLRVDDLRRVGPEAALFVGLLIFVARPICVMASTLRSRLSWRERLFLMWLAPRGIVAAAIASVFALALEQAGNEQARLLLPVTFGTIVITVAFYGLALTWVARWLGLADRDAQGVLIAGASRFARDLATALRNAGFRVILVDTNYTCIIDARSAGLEVYHGSILDDELHIRLSLAGIGKLLAITPNDEVNLLATEKLAHLFGRRNVFQIAPKPGVGLKNSLRTYTAPLFGQQVTFPLLEVWLASGATMKTTNLTGEFDYAAYAHHHGDDYLPLFVIDKQRLMPVTGIVRPVAGKSVLSLVRPHGNGNALESGAPGATTPLPSVEA